MAAVFGTDLLSPLAGQPGKITAGQQATPKRNYKGGSEMIKLKRVYEPAASGDGTRFLVERLWPRGVKKSALQMDAWLKEVAPSTELRQWFSHDPAKWSDFRARYFRELRANRGAIEPIVTAARRGAVTLLYSSHDAEHNNAVALKDYIGRRLRRKIASNSAKAKRKNSE
jgi:uncharacterized protein YeaO (DUF488 family)